MASSERFIHRTMKVQPTEHEKNLSRTLIGILGRGIHDLAGIVAKLNESPFKPESGDAWSEKTFAEEMERLGAYPNSVGAPLGMHPTGVVPVGASTDVRLPPMKS